MCRAGSRARCTRSQAGGTLRVPNGVRGIVPCPKVLEKKVKVVNATEIKEYPLLARGKVRDIYEIDADTLLLVTTDRMSAFDVIMSSHIPYKGVVLNQITLFWMDRFKDIIPNHLISADAKDLPANLARYAEELDGRFVLVNPAALRLFGAGAGHTGRQ